MALSNRSDSAARGDATPSISTRRRTAEEVKCRDAGGCVVSADLPAHRRVVYYVERAFLAAAAATPPIGSYFIAAAAAAA